MSARGRHKELFHRSRYTSWPLRGGELEDGAAASGEGGIPLWGMVPAGRIDRAQPGGEWSGRSEVLQ
jgi:hypothetical protein